ncbi:MAG TPA: alpha-glucan family phosphorylase [Nocardioidaceae bacterium]|nr:alpha-glucan family phosphorylase [Nocardioidaceae bacterium]
MHAIRRFTVRPVLPEPLRPLSELALNLRWSWHSPTQDLFASADPAGWEASGHDPMRLLGSLSVGRLEQLASDEAFVERLTEAANDLHEYLHADRWYQESVGEELGPRAIGYFSPEFGITSVLPQYSGGLGILAGDHLKSASDLGVPLVGVGLFYRHGYFRQSLSREGWQQETYPVNDPDGLPLTLLCDDDGSVPHVTIDLPGGRTLVARVWVAQVGRVPLLLLDSEKSLNRDLGIDVTDRLYGGGSEHRLLQEVLLGVGGVRALRLYSRITGAPDPEVFHTNEGHAGFLGLERIRELVQDHGLDFATAVEVVRGGTLFTTHTPVPAGIDRFPSELVAQHFGGDVGVPGVPVQEVLALGAEDYPGGDPTKFNMAVMGLRLAKRANGVSLLHGEVSRGMFAGLWPSFDAAEVPISSITNGVHAPTWMAREIIELLPSAPTSFESVDSVDGAALWRTKRLLRERLVRDVRRRLRESWLQRGAASSELGWVDSALDPDVLTIGFARRVPSYKRLTLMLRDPDRLRSLLLHPTRPIQLVIAGKSHPADDGGKKLIAELVRFADAADVRHRIVFLPDYDIAMAQPLYPGCDVWLNNPLRPYEACGTSGMKSALNGGLNLSILDGWWDEWFDGSNGWAIPSADGVEDVDRRDDIEAHALYDLVESEVAARFYDVDEDGLPTRWLEMVRHTLRSLGPKVLADRMLHDYVHEQYVPTVAAARALADVDMASDLAQWKQRVRASWPDVRVDYAEAEEIGDSPEVGSVLPVEAWVELGQLSVDDVDVQVVHGRVDDDDMLTDGSVTSLDADGTEGGRHRFAGQVVLDRTGPFGWTVRVLPRHDLLASPAETRLVRLPAELLT